MTPSHILAFALGLALAFAALSLTPEILDWFRRRRKPGACACACSHCRHREPACLHGKPVKGIYICVASPILKFDPNEGKMMPEGYRWSRDVNSDGHCKLFTPKEP